MKRDIVTLSAITALGLALLPTGVVAQQGTLREQLSGTWEVVSNAYPPTIPIVGTNPKGQTIFAPNGRFVTIVKKADRPRSAGRAEGFIGAFGTWRVDEATKTLTTHIDGATDSNVDGTELKSAININGDELRGTNTETKTTNVYRRVPQLQGLTGLKQQLVGTWEIVSNASPVSVPVVGTNPKGYLVLAGSGRYFNIARKADRPKYTERTGDGFLANSGTWSIDEANKTLTRYVENAMTTDIEGTDAKSPVSLNGDELKFTIATSNTTNVYKRVRASN